MPRQKSQLSGREHGEFPPLSKPASLYVVSTTIGHPDDISLRALRTLSKVSIVAAESPARIQKLLTRHGIRATITSYGPKNLAEKVLLLIDRLRKRQDVALVVDAGTPIIHDPGQLLIVAAYKNRLPVTVIPGPSAVTASVALSGYSGDRFMFAGQLPQANRAMLQCLNTFLNESYPTVFFVASRALPRMLRQIADFFGKRELTLAVDLTKAGELVLHGTAGSLIPRLPSLPHHSEITVVVGKRENRARTGGTEKAGQTTHRRCGDG